MATLPNLPLIQERFYNKIKGELDEKDIKYPEFEVLGVFLQFWGSTALGFGGIGGAAVTSAYTTVIENNKLGYVGVFFGERLAYIIYQPNDKFRDDLKARCMVDVMSYSKYEKSTVDPPPRSYKPMEAFEDEID